MLVRMAKHNKRIFSRSTSSECADELLFYWLLKLTVFSSLCPNVCVSSPRAVRRARSSWARDVNPRPLLSFTNKKKQPWSSNCMHCCSHVVEHILVLRDLLLWLRFKLSGLTKKKKNFPSAPLTFSDHFDLKTKKLFWISFCFLLNKL